MSLYDLLFLLLVLTTLLTLLRATYLGIRGRGGKARRLLRNWCVGAAAYFAIVIAVSLVAPRRVIELHAPLCWDDLCLAVENVQQTAGPAGTTYEVTLRMSSRARQRAQREKNVVAYLTDEHGGRYEPERREGDAPFDTLLQPQQAISVTRHFAVPAQAQVSGVVVTHEGGFPIGWFIIGYDSWFRKPTMVRIP